MKDKKPKIVYWDLETLPNPESVYKRLPSIGQWPGRTLKGELGSILCFGYQIEGQRKPKSINLWDFPTWEKDRQDDSLMVQAIYEILHDADEIVTHNGKRFDLKYLNTRLVKHGLPILPKIHHVDTKVVLKRHLSLYSNSLDAAAKFMGIEEKMKINDKWSLWYRIAFGIHTKKDLKIMDKYCKQDVDVLRQLHRATLSLHGNDSVNKNVWVDANKKVCPSCGSSDLTSNGHRVTGGTKYKRMFCGNCGSWSKLNVRETKVTPL